LVAHVFSAFVTAAPIVIAIFVISVDVLFFCASLTLYLYWASVSPAFLGGGGVAELPVDNVDASVCIGVVAISVFIASIFFWFYIFYCIALFTFSSSMAISLILFLSLTSIFVRSFSFCFRILSSF
jgi:hypothetical protein